MRRLTQYLWPVFLCLLAGYSTSLFRQEAFAEWYIFLFKPAFAPPIGAYPYVWTVLSLLIGISAGRIWDKGFRQSVREWWAQLALVFCWGVAFFLLQEALWAVGLILVLDAVVLDYAFITFKKDRWASLYFVPYALWLLWLTYLNIYLYLCN